jgi:hypothetical protein
VPALGRLHRSQRSAAQAEATGFQCERGVPIRKNRPKTRSTSRKLKLDVVLSARLRFDIHDATKGISTALLIGEHDQLASHDDFRKAHDCFGLHGSNGHSRGAAALGAEGKAYAVEPATIFGEAQAVLKSEKDAPRSTGEFA